ncbi:MAG TPA: F0F1 ATP synthase subunit A [Terriglobia bacterium]|nr:F0F1 ATP synthase subunit A [Terriglobia bacterium]
MEHELWFTAILNKLFAYVITPLLVAISRLPDLAFVRPADPLHPIPNYVAGEVLVLLVIVVGTLILRRNLSVENPGKLQMSMEIYFDFTRNLVDEVVGHSGRRYVAMVGALGLFILLCNIEGLIPTLITPTATVCVPFGCSVVVFLHYNYHGFRVKGIFGYLRHLGGPMVLISPLFFVVEVFSNVLRMLSLTARLWANMLAGVALPIVFASLIPIGVPGLFMGLHVFESFLQAYVFMILPALYISLATSEEH